MLSQREAAVVRSRSEPTTTTESNDDLPHFTHPLYFIKPNTRSTSMASSSSPTHMAETSRSPQPPSCTSSIPRRSDLTSRHNSTRTAASLIIFFEVYFLPNDVNTAHGNGPPSSTRSCARSSCGDVTPPESCVNILHRVTASQIRVWIALVGRVYCRLGTSSPSFPEDNFPPPKPASTLNAPPTSSSSPCPMQARPRKGLHNAEFAMGHYAEAAWRWYARAVEHDNTDALDGLAAFSGGCGDPGGDGEEAADEGWGSIRPDVATAESDLPLRNIPPKQLNDSHTLRNNYNHNIATSTLMQTPSPWAQTQTPLRLSSQAQDRNHTVPLPRDTSTLVRLIRWISLPFTTIP
ncbi:hypothetical protein M422DRAFT_270878 [Sphaerobolus stellatus SS14]|uniref:Uncharacterized protein n=1 Tax=Sphaerobolus stellatus (strain SS14) TaxID=990650 RepID=A0A0C9UFX6_SPHS4|nr:hypothetical protein M422DRAFT_270878 [Sphaerobolus stellatus SS14]